MFRTLRSKILASLVFASVISIAVSTLSVNYLFLRQERESVEHRLRLVAMMAHASLNHLMIQCHQKEMSDFISRIANQPPLTAVRIMNVDGEIKVSSYPEEVNTVFREPRSLYADSLFSHYYRFQNGQRIISSISPILRTQDCAACHPGDERILGYFDVDITADEIDSGIHSAQRWMVASSIFVVIIFITTAFGVHFRFVKTRTHQLAVGISQLAEGNFSYRIETKQKDELDALAVQINRLGDCLDQMKQELEKSHLSELERAERMASVGELAASIAHEIRNPVAGISSAMQVLMSELPAGDEKAIIFEEIVNQTQRVNRAVNDLLSYARPRTPELAIASINDPFSRALALMEAQKHAAKVEFVKQLEPNLPPVLLDVDQIKQVFVNLVMNALQAMHNGGILTLRTYAEGEEVIVEVSDTGPGIPENIVQDIFKPFFTTKHQGTGLGLSISRSIIESHCGRMEVQSVRGTGSTFRIRLPVHRLEEANEVI